MHMRDLMTEVSHPGERLMTEVNHANERPDD